MVVDELVSLIRFDVPGSSKTALNGVSKTVSRITDQIKSLGIVSAVTSGIMAAFSVNAAGEANSLANLSKETGLSRKELQAMSSVYAKLGGNAKDFAKDAQSYMDQTGRPLDLETMIDLSKRMSKMTEREAYQLAKAYGLSTSFVKTMRLGPEALEDQYEQAVRLNVTYDETLDKLEKLHEQWVRLQEAISPIADEIQAAFGVPLTAGIEELATYLENNSESIRKSITDFGKSMEEKFQWIRENGKTLWDDIGASGERFRARAATIWDDIGKAGEDFRNKNGGIWDEIGKKGESFRAEAIAIWKDITREGGDAKTSIGTLWDDIGTNGEAFRAKVKTIWEDIGTSGESFRNTVGTIWDEIGTKGEAFRGKVKSIWDDVGTSGEAFRSNVKTIWDEIGGSGDSFRSKVKEIWDDIGSYGESFRNDISQKITEAFDAAIAAAKDGWNRLVAEFQDGWNSITSGWNSFTSGVTNSSNNMFGTHKGAPEPAGQTPAKPTAVEAVAEQMQGVTKTAEVVSEATQPKTIADNNPFAQYFAGTTPTYTPPKTVEIPKAVQVRAPSFAERYAQQEDYTAGQGNQGAGQAGGGTNIDNLTVNQYITGGGDPVSTGNESAKSLNSLFPAANGHQYAFF